MFELILQSETKRQSMLAEKDAIISSLRVQIMDMIRRAYALEGYTGVKEIDGGFDKGEKDLSSPCRAVPMAEIDRLYGRLSNAPETRDLSRNEKRRRWENAPVVRHRKRTEAMIRQYQYEINARKAIENARVAA